MTRLPLEAERCETVDDAVSVMAANEIRHIPIMSGSHLKGIVSQRDILQARIDHGDSVASFALDEIAQPDVLSVSPITPIDEVARRMIGRKVGSAVVVDGGVVVGIFTTTDALRVLQDLRDL